MSPSPLSEKSVIIQIKSYQIPLFLIHLQYVFARKIKSCSHLTGLKRGSIKIFSQDIHLQLAVRSAFITVKKSKQDLNG